MMGLLRENVVANGFDERTGADASGEGQKMLVSTCRLHTCCAAHLLICSCSLDAQVAPVPADAKSSHGVRKGRTTVPRVWALPTGSSRLTACTSMGRACRHPCHCSCRQGGGAGIVWWCGASGEHSEGVTVGAQY